MCERSLKYLSKLILDSTAFHCTVTLLTMAAPIVTDEVRQYLRQLASHAGKSASRTAKSLAAKRNSAARWRLRRAKYGPSGRRYWPGWITEKYGPPIPPEQQAGPIESGS